VKRTASPCAAPASLFRSKSRIRLKQRKADDALGHADREGVHEGRGEPGVGPHERDPAGGERVIAQRAGQEKEGRQKDESLFGNADGPPAHGENKRQDGDDQGLPAADLLDQRLDAALDEPRPVEDAERSADDEDIEDDIGHFDQGLGKSQQDLENPRGLRLDGMKGRRVDKGPSPFVGRIIPPGRDDPRQDGREDGQRDEKDVSVGDLDLHAGLVKCHAANA
jgi:hypothetical protein